MSTINYDNKKLMAIITYQPYMVDIIVFTSFLFINILNKLKIQ